MQPPPRKVSFAFVASEANVTSTNWCIFNGWKFTLCCLWSVFKRWASHFILQMFHYFFFFQVAFTLVASLKSTNDRKKNSLKSPVCPSFSFRGNSPSMCPVPSLNGASILLRTFKYDNINRLVRQQSAYICKSAPITWRSTVTEVLCYIP